MARKVKISPITETSTYDDIAEAVEEADVSHVVETEITDEIKNETEPVLEAIPEVKPKAKRKSRAKREAPKAPVEQVETLVEPDVESPSVSEPVAEELDPTAPKPKARAKRVAKVKVVETPAVEETHEATLPVIEEPKAVRKPRVVKEISPLQPTLPVRMSRMAAREQLYQTLVSNALP